MWRSLAKLGGCLIGACCGFAASLVVSVPAAFTIWNNTGSIWNHSVFFFLIGAWPAVIAAVWGWNIVSQRVDFMLLQCQRCGYDLRGSTGDTCPECGHDINAEQRRYRAGRFHGRV